jgi:hypothetical protein
MGSAKTTFPILLFASLGSTPSSQRKPGDGLIHNLTPHPPVMKWEVQRRPVPFSSLFLFGQLLPLRESRELVWYMAPPSWNGKFKDDFSHSPLLFSLVNSFLSEKARRWSGTQTPCTDGWDETWDEPSGTITRWLFLKTCLFVLLFLLLCDIFWQLLALFQIFKSMVRRFFILPFTSVLLKAFYMIFQCEVLIT